MKLSEKIMKLRRASGLSQEELADKLGVSRQAVSKWESEQSMPDIDKIILLSENFGVTTDYLLKDGAEEAPQSTDEEPLRAEDTENEDERNEPVYSATLEDAKCYISLRGRAARLIAIAVMLCILSPTLIISLPVISEAGHLSETLAFIIGFIFLFSLIAVAVGLFIYSALSAKQAAVNDDTPCSFDADSLEYAKALQAKTLSGYIVSIAIGTVLCILSPLPLLINAFIISDRPDTPEASIPIVLSVSLLLVIVSVGVAMMTHAGVKRESTEFILRASHSEAKKKKTKLESIVTDSYWISVTAIYLLISFLTKRWDITWVIWIGAAVISNLISVIFTLKRK